MKNTLLILLTTFSLHVCAANQTVKHKSLLKAAKTAIKTHSGEENAEKNLLAALSREDITDGQRAEIYFMAEELEQSINAKENEKMYLKQKYDTLKFFSTVLQMHKHLIACDSVEVKSGKKFSYRGRARDIMNKYRKTLLNGGKFMLKKGLYADAFNYFDIYLREPYMPMFEYNQTLKADTTRSKVFYWATITGYNANNPSMALSYIDSAIVCSADTLRPSLCEYKVRCYEALKDTANYIETLEQSVKDYSAHNYFYLHLIDYYAEAKKYDEGIALSDTLLKKVGEREIYYLGKSQMQLRKCEYEDCIETCNYAIALDSTLVDAYYNKGLSYLNMAIIFAETACSDIRNPKCKRDRIKLQGLYNYARQPIEQVRKLKPDDVKRWAPILYKIYLYLNLGDEFAEIEQLLKNA